MPPSSQPDRPRRRPGTLASCGVTLVRHSPISAQGFLDRRGMHQRTYTPGPHEISNGTVNGYDGDFLVASAVYSVIFDKRLFNVKKFLPDAEGPFIEIPHRGKPFMVLHDIYVAPTYRGSGLFEDLVGRIRAQGLPLYCRFYGAPVRKWFMRNLAVD